MTAAPLVGDALPRVRGTYGLTLHLPETMRCRIGALGVWSFPAGFYLYVGSAWGPGGLRARVGRHLRGAASLRWHIDYLRQHADPAALWLAPNAHLECVWAHYLTHHPNAEVTVPRFGASDCRCSAHLFRLGTEWRALALPGAPDFLALRPAES